MSVVHINLFQYSIRRIHDQTNYMYRLDDLAVQNSAGQPAILANAFSVLTGGAPQTSDTLGRGQTRIYRYTVAAGQQISVHVEPIRSDPDLYLSDRNHSHWPG